MKTISTLCATSTIGAAACGLVFGRPVQYVPNFPAIVEDDQHYDDTDGDQFEGEYDQSRDHSPNNKRLSGVMMADGFSNNAGSSSSTHRITLASPPSFSALTASSQETSTTPASSIGRGKRKWLRRFSESLSPAASRSHSPNSGYYSPNGGGSRAGTAAHSRVGSRAASRQGRNETSKPVVGISPGTVAQLVRRFSGISVGSRPSTGNKSPLRRSNSRRAASSRPSARSQTPAGASSMNVSTPRRPSTFGYSTTRKAQRQSLFSSFGLDTPTATETRPSTDFSNLRPYDPEPVESWRMYFQPRLIADRSSKNGTKRFTVSSPLRFFRRIYPNFRYHPTLISPTAVEVIPEEEDFDSDEYIDCTESVYFDDSVPPTPVDSYSGGHKRRNSGPRRSLSLSGFVANNSFAKRRRRFTNSVQTPTEVPPQVELDLPGAQLSETEFQTPPESPPRTAQMEPAVEEVISPRNVVQYDVQMMDIDTERGESSNGSQGTQRSRRLSLILSEHASTLIGSEDIDMDFQSDTVFDSIRTRASPSHPPLGLDNIFNSDMQEYVLGLPGSPMFPTSADGMPHSGSSDRLRGLYKASLAERRHVHTPLEIAKSNLSSQSNSAHNTEPENHADDEDEDDDTWSEDWDVPLSPKPENAERLQLYTTAGDSNRESNSLTFPRTKQQQMQQEQMQHSRQSSSIDAFKLSFDGSENGGRPDIKAIVAGTTTTTQEVTIPVKKGGRKRAPSTHLRSQSLPTVGKGVPSENWDDDFDEMQLDSIVVPRAIEDAQKSVVTHLANVRDFASQIDDLKVLYASATSKGLRFGNSKHLWDEADCIITLATVDSGETTIQKSPNAPSWPADPFDETPSNSSTESLPRFPRVSRRNSVLAPDDNIFGIHDNKPSSRTASPISKRVQKQNAWKHKSRNSGDRSEFRLSDRSMSEQIIPQIPKTSSPCPGVFSKAALERGEKLHFDSTMLPELISYVDFLRKDLKRVLEDEKLQNSSAENLAKEVRRSRPEQLDIFNAWSGFEEVKARSSPRNSKVLDQKSPRDVSAHELPVIPVGYRIPKPDLKKSLPPTPAGSEYSVPKMENNKQQQQGTHGRRKSRMGLEEDGTRRSSLMTFV